jgi:hypothetical protein
MATFVGNLAAAVPLLLFVLLVPAALDTFASRGPF